MADLISAPCPKYGVQLKKDGTYTVHDADKIQEKYKFDAAQTFSNALQIKKLIGGYE
jgi:hypothetical protein